jgi:hypothetical protein
MALRKITDDADRDWSRAVDTMLIIAAFLALVALAGHMAERRGGAIAPRHDAAGSQQGDAAAPVCPPTAESPFRGGLAPPLWADPRCHERPPAGSP